VRAQASAETVLLLGLAVAALVAMAWYVQRGYQGYLYASTSGQGPQFDPGQPYADTRSLNAYAVDQQVEVTSTEVSVELPAGVEPCPIIDRCLPDMAGGKLGGRILRTKVNVNTTWDMGRNATFNAQ